MNFNNGDNAYQQLTAKLNKMKFKEFTKPKEDQVYYENIWNLEWNNPVAIQRVYQTAELFNRSPDVLGRKAGQTAIWYNAVPPNGFGEYSEVQVKDVAYKHHGHMDFYFTRLRMKLDPDKAQDIQKISEGAYYYPVGQELSFACHTIEPAIAVFSVIKEYNDDKVTLEEAKSLKGERVTKLVDEFNQTLEKGESLRSSNRPYKEALEEYIMSGVEFPDPFELPESPQNMEPPMSSLPLTIVEDLNVVLPIPSPEKELKEELDDLDEKLDDMSEELEKLELDDLSEELELDTIPMLKKVKTSNNNMMTGLQLETFIMSYEDDEISQKIKSEIITEIVEDLNLPVIPPAMSLKTKLPNMPNYRPSRNNLVSKSPLKLKSSSIVSRPASLSSFKRDKPLSPIANTSKANILNLPVLKNEKPVSMLKDEVSGNTTEDQLDLPNSSDLPVIPLSPIGTPLSSPINSSLSSSFKSSKTLNPTLFQTRAKDKLKFPRTYGL